MAQVYTILLSIAISLLLYSKRMSRELVSFLKKTYLYFLINHLLICQNVNINVRRSKLEYNNPY